MRVTLAALVLIPLGVLAQLATHDPDSLQSLPLEKLCEQPRSQDVLAEFGRRDVFSKRELRSIETSEIRTRISETALLCIRPMPDQVFHTSDLVADRLGIEAAYLYSTGRTERLLVYMKQSFGELRVSAVTSLPFGAGIPAVLRADFTFPSVVPNRCLSSGGPGSDTCYGRAVVPR